MFKGLGNLASLMKQAQEIQGRMSDVQENLSRIQVQGSSGGGMVTIQANGQQKILSCSIDSSLFEQGDQEMIEDLMVAAVNMALDKAKEAASQELSKVAQDVELPGLGDALSKLGLGGRHRLVCSKI